MRLHDVGNGEVVIELLQGEELDRMSRDLATFENPPDAIDTLVKALGTEFTFFDAVIQGIRKRATQQRIKRKAIIYNHGRARKVSFKRPSPQLSRAMLREAKKK